MRNDLTAIKTISETVSDLPYFTMDNLSSVTKDKHYLKIILSRKAKKGDLIRLKKGSYVSKNYLDNAEKRGILSHFVEFTANLIYSPSYLSLEYVLYENNILTEAPKNMTSVSTSKTASFSNKLGNFFYHKMKSTLFIGYDMIKSDIFTILKATRAKAVFDFLYFRKNSLPDEKAILELRLNLDNLTSGDWKDLEKYVNLENSKKMKAILIMLKKIYGKH